MRERLLNYSHHLRRLRLMVLVAVLAVPIGAAGQIKDPNAALNLDFKEGLAGWKLYHGVVKYGGDIQTHQFCWNYDQAVDAGAITANVKSAEHQFKTGYGSNGQRDNLKGSDMTFKIADIFSGGASGSEEGENCVYGSGDYYWSSFDAWKGDGANNAPYRRFNVYTKGSTPENDINFGVGNSIPGSTSVQNNNCKDTRIDVTGGFARTCRLGTNHGIKSGRGCELQYYGKEQGLKGDNDILEKHVASAEMMEYEFVCTEQMGMLIVDYCAIAMNPSGHSGGGVVAKPLYYIKAECYDEVSSKWNAITCGATVKNTDDMLRCDNKKGSTNDDVVTTNWESVAFDLTEKDTKGEYKYRGKKIRLQAYVTDCCYGSVSDAGGHACYMYFRAEVKPLKIDVEFCKSNEPVTITAPAGYDSYTWYQMGETDVWSATMQSNDDIKGNKWELGAGSVGSSNNHFHVTMKMNSTGCPIELDTIISPTDLRPNFTPKYGCNRYVDFVDASTSESASGSGASDSVVIWNWTVFPAGADPVIDGVKQSASNAVYYAVDKDADGRFLFQDAKGDRADFQSSSKRNYGSVLDAEGQWVVMEVKTVSGCEGLICKKIVPRFVPVNTVVIKNACLYSPVFGTVKNVPVNYADWQNLDDAYFKPGVGRPTEDQVKAEGFNASDYLRNDYLYYLKNNISYSFDEGATWVSRMEGGTQVDIDPEAVRAGNIVRKFLVKDTWEDESGKENYCIYNVNTEYEVYEVPNALPIATDNVGLTRVKEGVMKTETATIRYSEWQVGVCKDKSVTLHLECDGKYGLTWSDGATDDMSYSNILNGSYETNNKTLAKGTHSVDMSNGNCTSRIYVSVVEGSQDVKLEVGPAVCAPGPVEASLVNIEKGYVEWGKLVSAIDDQGNAIQKEEQLAAGEYEFALGEADFTSQYYVKGTDDKGCNFNIPFMFEERPAARPDFTFTFKQSVPANADGSPKKDFIIVPNESKTGDPMEVKYDATTKTFTCSPLCGYNADFNNNRVNVAVKNPNVGAKNCYMHYTWYKNTGIVEGKDENVWRTNYQPGGTSYQRDLLPNASYATTDEYTLVVTTHTFDDAKTVICEDVYTIKIQSRQTPTVTWNVSVDGSEASSSTDQACVGSAVKLTASGLSDGNVVSYTWYDPTKTPYQNLGNGMLGDQENGTTANSIYYTVGENGNSYNKGYDLYSYKYAVRVEDEKGCIGVSSKEIWVKPLPKFVVPDVTGCPRETDAAGNPVGKPTYVTLEAKDLYGGSHKHNYNNTQITKGYSWENGAFDVSDEGYKKDVEVTATATNPQTVKVAAMASNGCVGTLDVTVSAYPEFDIKVDAIRTSQSPVVDNLPVNGVYSVCAGTNFWLNMEMVLRDANAVYAGKYKATVTRKRDGTVKSSSASFGQRVDVGAFTAIDVVIKGQKEEFSIVMETSEGCRVERTLIVEINPRPMLSFDYVRNFVCEDGSSYKDGTAGPIEIKAVNATNPTTGAEFDKTTQYIQWTAGTVGSQVFDAEKGELSGTVVFVEGSDYRTYKATITTAQGCKRTEETQKIYNVRKPEFEVVAKPSELCENEALQVELIGTSDRVHTYYYSKNATTGNWEDVSWQDGRDNTSSPKTASRVVTGDLMGSNVTLDVRAGNSYYGAKPTYWSNTSDKFCFVEKQVTVTSKPVPVVTVEVLDENQNPANGPICDYSKYYLKVASQLTGATGEMIDVDLDINGEVKTDSKLEAVPANGNVVIGPFSPVNNSADVVNFSWKVVGGECGGSSKTEVKIAPRPVARILVSGNVRTGADGVYEVCENTQLTLSSAYGADSYSWTSNIGSSSTEATMSVTPVFKEGENNEFYLVVTENGCQSEQTTLKVSVVKSPSFTAWATLDPVCENCLDTIMVSDGNNMQNNYIYKAYTLDADGNRIQASQKVVETEFVKTENVTDENGVVTGTIDRTYYIYKTPFIGQNTVYEIEAEDAGCFSSQKVAVNMSNTPVLELVDATDESITIANGDAYGPVCKNSTVKLKIRNTSGAKSTIYQLSRLTPGSLYTWGKNPQTYDNYYTFTLNADKTHEYEIRAITNDSCVAYHKFKVIVKDAPTVFTTGNYQPECNYSFVCSDFAGELPIKCVNASETIKSWEFEAGTQKGNDHQNIVLNPRSPDPNSKERTTVVYKIKVTDTYGCTQTASHTVYFHPAPNFNVEPESPVCLEDDGANVKFTASKVKDGGWYDTQNSSLLYSLTNNFTSLNNGSKDPVSLESLFSESDVVNNKLAFDVYACYKNTSYNASMYCVSSKKVEVDVIHKPTFTVVAKKNDGSDIGNAKLCPNEEFFLEFDESRSNYSDVVTYTVTDHAGNVVATVDGLFGGKTQTESIIADKTATYTVTAVAKKGCSAVTSTVTVNVERPFSVSIASSKKTSGVSDICKGETVTLSAVGLQASELWNGGVGDDVYEWSTSEKTKDILCAVNDSKIYKVKVKNANGCWSEEATHNVVVHPNPIVSIEDQPSGCAGSDFEVKANATIAEGSIANYKWFSVVVENGPDGMPNTSDDEKKYSYKNEGETFEATFNPSSAMYGVAAYSETYGCSDTIDFKVDVLANPDIVVEVDNIPGVFFEECIGTPMTLVASNKKQSNAETTFRWKKRDGTSVDGANGNSLTVTPNSANEIGLIVEAEVDACVSSKEISYVGKPNPVAVITANVCSGMPGVLNATVNEEGATLVWNGDAAAKDKTYELQNPQAGDVVKLQVTGSNGCITEIEHIVNPVTAPSVTIMGPSGVCLNTNFKLNSTVKMADGVAIRWYKGDELDANGKAVYGSAPIDQGKDEISQRLTEENKTVYYKVEVTIPDGNGAYCSSSAEFTVTPYPVPSFSVADAKTCAGSFATFNMVGANNTGYAQNIKEFRWADEDQANKLFPDDTVSNSSFMIKPDPAKTTSYYKVYGVSHDGCVTDVKRVSVTVNPLPKVEIKNANGNASDFERCSNEGPIVLKAEITTGQTAVSYDWGFGVGTSSEYSFSNVSDHTVKVVVVDNNGCAGSAEQLVSVNLAPTITVFDGASGDQANSHRYCADPMSPVTLETELGGGVEPESFTWTLNGVQQNVSQSYMNVKLADNDDPKFNGNSYYSERYGVKVTDVNGCTSSEAVFTVNVDKRPEVVAVAPADVCPGSETVIQLTGAQYYVVVAPEGDFPVTGNEYREVLYSDKIFKFQGISALAGEPGACYSNVEEVTAKVKTAPMVSISEPERGGNLQGRVVDACENESVELTATASGGVGNYTYSWSQSSKEATYVQTLSGGSSGLYPFTVEVRDDNGNGCPTKATVTFKTTPSPVVYVSASKEAVCDEYEQVSLKACHDADCSDSQNSDIAYEWKFDREGVIEGGGTAQTAALGQIESDVLVTLTARMVSTGCVSKVAEKTIKRNATPEFSVFDKAGSDIFGPSYGKVLVCEGEAANLSVKSTNTSGLKNVEWTMAGSLRSDQSTFVSHNFVRGSSDTTYTVTVQGGNGCYASKEFTVGVKAPIELTVDGPYDPKTGRMVGLCEGTDVVFKAFSSDGAEISWTAPLSKKNSAQLDYTLIGDQVKLEVTATLDGCIQTLSKDYKIYDSPAIGLEPKDLTLKDRSNSICEGSSVELTAVVYSLDLQNDVEWQWLNEEYIPFSDRSEVSVTPAKSGKYYLEGIMVYDGNTVCKSTKEINITVVGKPKISASFTPSDSVCSNESVTLNLGGANAYRWNKGTMYDDLNAEAVNGGQLNIGMDHVAGTVNEYAIKGYGVHQFTSGEVLICEADTIVNLMVYAAPNVSLSAPETSCPDVDVMMIASGAETYLWSGADVNGLTDNYVKVKPQSAAVSFDYTVHGTKVVDRTTEKTCTASASATVKILPKSRINMLGENKVCAGDNAKIKAEGVSLNGKQPYVDFIWSTGEKGDSISSLIMGDTKIFVTGRDTNNCFVKDSVMITAQDPDGFDIKLADDVNTKVCEGSAVTLKVEGATDYKWEDDPTNTSSQMQVSPVSNTSYTVEGTYGVCTKKLTIPVYIVSAPAISVVGNTMVCRGSTMNLQATSQTEGLVYEWVGAAASGPDLSVVPMVDGAQYTVKATDPTKEHCDASKTVTVTLREEPNVAIGGDFTVCENTYANLTATGAVSYVWGYEDAAGNPVNNVAGGSNYQPAIGNSNLKVFVIGVDEYTCSKKTDVVVTSVPTPKFKLTTETGTNVFCEGSDVVLMHDAVNSDAISSIVWNGKDTAMKYTEGDMKYSRRFSATGYSDQGCQAHATIDIDVLPKPNLSIGGNLTPCQDTKELFTAYGADRYMWKGALAQQDADNKAEVAIGANASSIRIELTGYKKMDDVECRADSVFVIPVKKTPSVQIDGGDKACMDGVLTLKAVTEDEDITSLIWTDNSSYPFNRSGNEVQVSVTQDVTYKLSATNIYGCKKDVEHFVKLLNSPSLDVNMNVDFGNPKSGQLEFNENGIAYLDVCNGGDLNLVVSGSNTYKWDHRDAVDTTVSALDSVITTAATFVVKGYMPGCETSRTIVVSHKANPSIDLVGNRTVCEGSPVVLEPHCNDSNVEFYWRGRKIEKDQETGKNLIVEVLSSPNNKFDLVGIDTVNNCQTVKTYTDITYTAKPKFAVDGDKVVCVDDEIDIRAYAVNSADDEGNYTYNWGYKANPKIAIDYDTELNVLAQTAGVDDFFASVKDTVGCVDTIFFSVTKNPLPVLTFDPQGSDNDPATPEIVDICMKNDLYVRISGASTIKDEAGNVISGGWIKDKPDSDTIYKVSGASSEGCVSTLEIPVKTIPSPVIYLTNHPDGELAYCEGSPVKLVVGGNAVSYTMPDGTKGTNGATYVDEEADGLMTYFITGEGDNGCSVQEEFTFKMNTLPEVAIDIEKDQDRICYREVAELHVTGAESYKWSTGSRKDTIRATITKDSVFTVVGKDANGCESEVSFKVTMVELPVLAYNGDTEFCDGNTATLRGSGTGVGGGDYYAWSVGKDTIAMGNLATTKLNGNTTYTLWGKSKEGCVSSLDVDITAKEAPILFWEGEYELNETADSILLCQKQTLDITMKGADTYQWTGGSTTDRLTVVPTRSTHYTVTGTGANGCKTTQAINVKVLPTPTIKIDAPTFACVGEDFQMKVTDDTKDNFESFAWSNHSTEATSGDLTMTEEDYTLKVTGYTSLNCPAEASFTVKPKALPKLYVRGTKEICKGGVFSLHGQGANTYAWFMDENGYYGNDTAKVGDQISFEAATDEVLVMSGTLNGCTDTIHVPLSVQTPPILHTEGLKPICQGEVLELTAKATNVNEEDKVEFTWSTGTVTGENGEMMSMTPLSSQNIYLSGSVVLLDDNGDQIFCKNTLEIPVTVNPKPTIKVEGERNICFGSEAELTAVGAAAYEWVELSSSETTVRPIITSDTSFTVKGKVVETGCDAEAVVKVKVKPLPVLGVAEGSKLILCDGEEADITVFGAATYGWKQPDGSLVAGNRYRHTPEQDTIYRVIGTSNNNCVDSFDIEVSVNMLPSLSYSGDSEICSGDSLILFGHSAPEGCTFSWSNGDKGDKMEAKPLVSATYTLTGKDGNGCVTSMEIPVVVNQRTPLNLAGTSNVCAGSQAEVYVVDAEGFTAFNWSNGNVGENIKPHVSEKTTFTAEGIDVNGCVTKAEFTVNVTEIPELSFHGDTVVCLGDEVSLLADGASKYNWRDVDGNLLSDKARYTFKPDVETKLILEGYMSNCKAEREIPIMVNAVPNLEVDMPEFICRGSVGELRATAGAGVTFEWSTGETEKVIEVAPNKSTYYTVTATNEHGCDSTVKRTVLVVEPPKVEMETNKDNNMVCPGQPDTVHFSATGAVSYEWSSVPAVADIDIYNSDKTNFWAVLNEGEDVVVTVVGTDEKGCQASDTKTIAQRELEPMQFVINPNCIDNDNPSVRFSGKVPDHENAVWTWTPGEDLEPITVGSADKNVVTYKYDLPLKDSFEVKVRSVDEHGCIQDGSGWVYKWRDFWAAEAFTPNGDKRNDEFYFHGGDFIEEFTFIIYNRMGEVIFEGKSIDDKWDGNYKGEPCPTGVYGWTVKYGNNSATLSKKGERKGMVTIVR
ncbi:MAG: gliding motility-associated C-terminal domain-containing protein [Paludibacteraceae bacterium]|nr:gliding motility-associated C-terminal domain-containing protein [Paludibacteraceae bacterium]